MNKAKARTAKMHEERGDREGHDFFGKHVNLAARIAGQASGSAPEITDLHADMA